ncbi:MAG: hypothetical protein FJ280_12215 [Planctomycetes bacterium]|nr:hypothetical protein [Planctomycetota bacterium]
MRDRTAGIWAGILALACLAGCQQPQEAPGAQQARLLAAQAADLQRELTARQAEIETLRQKHTRELRQRDHELIRCKVRIDALQQDLQKGIDERVRGVTAAVMDENAKLRREIERLKAEIERLKAAAVPPGGP